MTDDQEFFNKIDFNYDNDMHQDYLVIEPCNDAKPSADNSAEQECLISPKTQRMLIIGAILMTKFILWHLYKSASENDVDISGL